MAVIERAGEIVATKGDTLIRDFQILNSDGDPIETMAGALVEFSIRQTDSSNTVVLACSTVTGEIVISDVPNAVATLTVSAGVTDLWTVGVHRYALRVTDGAGRASTAEVGRFLLGQDYITP